MESNLEQRYALRFCFLASFMATNAYEILISVRRYIDSTIETIDDFGLSMISDYDDFRLSIISMVF